MASTENQRKAFQFLVERFRSQETFTKEEFFGSVPGWTGQSPRTYWSKHIKHFLVRQAGKRFRVSEAFRPYSNWRNFRRQVTQVRRTFSDYSFLSFDTVVIFDFLMPLTNEGHLRTALDALFYQDTVLARLRAMPESELTTYFPRIVEESADEYLERVRDWVSNHFGGYSISHVNGRFRAAPLATAAGAAELQQHGDRYLVDETTAVVRFIFPCENTDAAESVRWFFESLFVQSVLQVVNGEDEIWMLESGYRSRLHIWRLEED